MIQEFISLFEAVIHFRIEELKKSRLLKILCIGAFGFIVQTSFFETFAIQFKLFRPSTAAVLGAELAIIINFFLHSNLTFPDRRAPNLLGNVKRFFQFNTAVAVSLIFQWIMVRIGEEVAPESAFILRLFNIGGIIIGFLFNYMSYTRIVWRDSARKD